jgi:hypothetical protein
VNNIYFSILPKHPAHCEKTLAVPHEIVRRQGYACLRKAVEITHSSFGGHKIVHVPRCIVNEQIKSLFNTFVLDTLSQHSGKIYGWIRYFLILTI